MFYSFVQVFYFLVDLLSGFLFIIKNGLWYSPNITVELPVSAFNAVYFHALLLGVYMMTILMSS